MVNFYNNLSPTTKLVLQSFLAVLGSVLVGVATALMLSYTKTGYLDIQTLISVCTFTFALLFGKAMHDWIPAHAQQLIQAGNEEKAALYDALQRSQTIIASPITTTSSSQPPVIIQATASPSLTPDHIQALSQQIALNLTNMAAGPAQQVPPVNIPVNTTTSIQSAPAPYEDPLRVSAVLPAYVPQVPFPGQAV